MKHRLHPELNLIEVRPVGVVRISDILGYARAALSAGLVSSGTIEYYDLSGMTNLELDYQSARALTETLQEWRSCGWAGSVYFTPKDVQFGMIRMLDSVVDVNDVSPGPGLVPSRTPVPLEGVRAFLAAHRRG